MFDFPPLCFIMEVKIINYLKGNFFGKTERFRDRFLQLTPGLYKTPLLKHSCFYMYKEISLIKRLTITSFLSWKVVIVPCVSIFFGFFDIFF